MTSNCRVTDSERTVAVAVTGGMGAGKSAVANFLSQRLHWPLLSADVVCRSLLTQGNEGWNAFVAKFGSGAVGEDGEVNRAHLRQLIFEDASMRRKLESILHPLARREICRQTTRLKREGKSVLVEVPLLYEAGWQDDFDKVLVVFAAESVCLARICQRDGVFWDDARKGIAAQMPLWEKALTADYVVDNSGYWNATLLQLIHLCKILDDQAGSLGKKT